MTIEQRMERRLQQAEAQGMHPLLKEHINKRRSVFFPGHRIRMNVIPMFIGTFLPWGFFIVCFGVLASSLTYNHPIVVAVIIVLVVIFWLGTAYSAVRARRDDPDPTWFTYLAIAIFIAIVAGIALGAYNYITYLEEYYEVMDLKVITNINVTTEKGQDVMDAGVLQFSEGTMLSDDMAWHFKYSTTYCITPVISNSSVLTVAPMLSYDFFAVGTDCCSETASDFRCGDYDDLSVRSGLRIIDDTAIKYYTLAVEQAISLYSINSPHPIFFQWLSEPLTEVNSWKTSSTRNFVGGIAFAFVTSLFFVFLATCFFAWIGRRESPYDTEVLSDPNWKHGVAYQKPLNPAHLYT